MKVTIWNLMMFRSNAATQFLPYETDLRRQFLHLRNRSWRLFERILMISTGRDRAVTHAMDRREFETRSQAFALAITRLCAVVRTQPNWRQQADQLLDAATSTGANYRASGRARSRAEFVAKLGTVNEEIDEAVYWLELMLEGQAAGPHRPSPGRITGTASHIRSLIWHR